MELPFHLRALPPEALDVLRFFGSLDEPVAHAVYIMDGAGLSERIFGKAVRRLVTKGYLQMDGDQVYRLTELGSNAAEELAVYGEFEPDEMPGEPEPAVVRRQARRRLVLALPRALVAGAPSAVYVGFHSAARDAAFPAELVVRLSVVNGEPSRPRELSFNLADAAACQTFDITPGAYSQVRLRLQVYQLGPNPDDTAMSGGMYVDVPVVSRAEAAGDLAAFGADILVMA